MSPQTLTSPRRSNWTSYLTARRVDQNQLKALNDVCVAVKSRIGWVHATALPSKRSAVDFQKQKGAVIIAESPVTCIPTYV